MTASELKGDWEMCLAAGMDGYISKPSRIMAIREALEACSKRDGDLGDRSEQMRKSRPRLGYIRIWRIFRGRFRSEIWSGAWHRNMLLSKRMRSPLRNLMWYW